MSKKIGNIISAHRYDLLTRFSKSLTDKEKKQIRDYEKHRTTRIEENRERFKVKEPKERTPITRLPYQWLRDQFKQTWEAEEGKPLEVDPQRKPIYQIVCQYFAKDEDFDKTEITENIPSLKKSLLLIGDYGCGKTSMFRAYHNIGRKLLPDNFLWFTMVSCNALVAEFEQLETPKERGDFSERYAKIRAVYFDDFGTEEQASNYGKKNLMKDILEERYIHNKTTFLTTNLDLEGINQKYGGRVFDRLQEMFNIIRMPGGSFRK